MPDTLKPSRAQLLLRPPLSLARGPCAQEQKQQLYSWNPLGGKPVEAIQVICMYVCVYIYIYIYT